MRQPIIFVLNLRIVHAIMPYYIWIDAVNMKTAYHIEAKDDSNHNAVKEQELANKQEKTNEFR